MGQKVNPHGLRVGVIKDWDTRWYADKKNFANFLIEDHKIREVSQRKVFAAGISRIEIERAASKITINIYTGKPGMIIGKGGTGIEALKDGRREDDRQARATSTSSRSQPRHDAQLVAENIAPQLEKRISFRRAMKQAIGRAMKMRRQGHQDHGLRPPGRRGNRPQRGLPRGHHPAADPARRHRLRLCRSQDHLRPHRRQGMDLQGRSPQARLTPRSRTSLPKESTRRRQSHVDAEESQAPKSAPRPHEGQGHPRQLHHLRRIRPGGAGTLLDHQPTRSKPPVSR